MATTQLDDYSVCTRRSVAWGDMDAFGHVNNVQYFRYFEDARIRYFEDMGIYNPERPEPFEGIGPILAETSCQFKAPLTYPAEIETGVRTAEILEDRFVLEYAIVRPDDDCRVATGDSTVVTYDYQAGHPVEVPDHWRMAIDAIE